MTDTLEQPQEATSPGEGRTGTGLKLFICYSHQDEVHKTKLINHLASLRRSGLVDTWHDRRIDPGDRWRKNIDEALNDCDVGLLLVSDDFLASEFINTVELKRLLQRAAQGKARVIPIIVRDCLWLWSNMRALQALPKDGRPIVTFSEESGDRDTAWTEIARTIADLTGSPWSVPVSDQAGEPAAADPDWEAVPTQAEEPVRRTVVRTCMFCELTGHDDIVRRLDDEDMSAIIQQYRDALENVVVQEHGGRVERVVGAEAFVTFPNPSQAIAASLQLQQRLTTPGANTGIEADLRIGIHQGEVTEDQTGHTELLGRHVNSAAQVCKTSDPGQILVTSGVFEGSHGGSFKIPQKHLRWLSHGEFYLPSVGPMELYEVADLRYREPAPPCTVEAADRPANARRFELSGFQIESRVGEGGMGIVYRARRRTDDRTVALKVLGRGLESSDADRERFVREVQAIQRLRHEGIVNVQEVHHDVNPPFFAMEWIDGKPITEAIGDATWQAKAEVLVKVCDALAHAHEHGVIHGDLKPNNVIVDAAGKPTVLDFGLSRLLDSEDGVSLTSSSGVVGTPLYLAPEQADGRGQIDVATDIYALGAIVYELLAGAPPFPKHSFHGVLDAHLHESPTLPVIARRNVPEGLQRICLKALEKIPSDRYGSMLEMRQDLDRFGRGEPPLVRPSVYNNLIESSARKHISELDQWYRRQLITSSERAGLHRAYRRLLRSGLQAVSESRLIHLNVLALYLGGWLVLVGATLWLEQYWGKGVLDSPAGRIVVGLFPALLANLLWAFFHHRGAYRFAFVAMIIGMVSMPFAVGILIYETAEFLKIDWLRDPLALKDGYTPLFDKKPFGPNIQLFIAFAIGITWSAYLAIRTRTVTSTAIVALQGVLLYALGLDFIGLVTLAREHTADTGLYTLPLAAILVASGFYLEKRLARPRQAASLFAAALAVAILASQAIAVSAPNQWYFTEAKEEITQFENDKEQRDKVKEKLKQLDDDAPSSAQTPSGGTSTAGEGTQQLDAERTKFEETKQQLLTRIKNYEKKWIKPSKAFLEQMEKPVVGLLEAVCGMLYLAFSVYLYRHFRVDAAAAYLILTWLAPLAFLGGLAYLDHYWPEAWEPESSLSLFGKDVPLTTLLLLTMSIFTLLSAARFQSYFFIVCGLAFTAYVLAVIAYDNLKDIVLWPIGILASGLIVALWISYMDYRTRVGQDIDDLGERMIARAALRAHVAGDGSSVATED